MSDIDIEFAETKLTLHGLSEENQTLRLQLSTARNTVTSLTESLAIANAEAEVFRRQFAELKLKMEALGLDSIGTDKSKLEQRLLKAVQDLQLLHEENEKLSTQIIKINEALIPFLKTAESMDHEARMNLELQIREANTLLGATPGNVAEANAVLPSLTDGMVISIKDELSLVVANLGQNHGVKIGMPFEVWRSDKQIGLVRVVDVRKEISGAVIQHLLEDIDGIKVGDRLKVETQYNF